MYKTDFWISYKGIKLEIPDIILCRYHLYNENLQNQLFKWDFKSCAFIYLDIIKYCKSKDIFISDNIILKDLVKSEFSKSLFSIKIDDFFLFWHLVYLGRIDLQYLVQSNVFDKKIESWINSYGVKEYLDIILMAGGFAN
tara:strand:- start:59 stop:478 length:420 start_codon:yes stop_codon:yes gene_type:complete